MPKAALYARYSSDLQNPQSIDDQLRDCRQLAQRKGWDLAEIYHDEAISGASIRGRAGIRRLLEDARGGRFDIQALHDWPMYGPKNPRIADLVRKLALDHSMHIVETEAVIEAALAARLQKLQDAQGVAGRE